MVSQLSVWRLLPQNSEVLSYGGTGSTIKVLKDSLCFSTAVQDLTETNVDSGTSQSKRGSSVNSSYSELPAAIMVSQLSGMRSAMAAIAEKPHRTTTESLQ